MPNQKQKAKSKKQKAWRKVLFSATFFLLLTVNCLLLTVHSVSAAPCDATANTSTEEVINNINKCAIDAKIFDDKIFNLNQIAGTTDSLYTMLTGKSQLHTATNTITAKSGALASSSTIMASLYTKPPASGVEYFAQAIQKFNPNQPAYAAVADNGIGFTALEPVQAVWTAFRNIAYAGFVIIFVVIGFMIMFRSHISPQAVATIQDSVPRIVVAIILVTFSYAIAGLMIDLMFLFLNVAINALTAVGLTTDKANTVLTNNIFHIVFHSWGNIVKEVAETVHNMLDDVINIPVIGGAITWFGGGIVGIIAGVAMLFVMFRIFMMLLMAYVTIILLTITAPFFFLLQALPGNNSATSWFKQMASNIAVFPAVALMIIMAGILSGISSLGGSGASRFASQQVGQFPLLSGGLDIQDIGSLIGLGFLLMTPSAAQIVKDAFGVKGGVGGAGAGAAQTFGAGAGVVGTGFGAARRTAAQSAPARAIGIASEERNTQSTNKIISRLPTWAKGGAAATPTAENRRSRT